MALAVDLDSMTVEEKLRLLEAVWQDLSRNPEAVPMPAWHAEVLEERERMVREGTAEYLDLDEVKQRLRERLG